MLVTTGSFFLPAMMFKAVNLKNQYYMSKIAKRAFFERKFHMKTKRVSILDIKKDIESRNYH